MNSTYARREIRSGDQCLTDQNRSVETGALAIPQPHSGENLRARSSRAIIYRASLLAFLVLAVLTWTQFNFSRRRFQTGNPFLHSLMRRAKKAIPITRSIYICKGRGSQPGATIGPAYSPPPAGLKI